MKTLQLTQAAWPTLLTVLNVVSQVRAGQQPKPEQVRTRVLKALREGAEISVSDPELDRAWNERVRRMLIYFVDGRLINLTQWTGRHWWMEHRLELDRDGLDEVASEGGDRFFEMCDQLQTEYHAAERINRPDKHLLAEQLSLFYSAIRLGFRGKYQDLPDEFDEYTRKVYGLIPGQLGIRDEELFPETTKHTITKKAIYPIGRALTIVLGTFLIVLVSILVTYNIVWRNSTKAIREAAESLRKMELPAGTAEKPPGAAG